MLLQPVKNLKQTTENITAYFWIIDIFFIACQSLFQTTPVLRVKKLPTKSKLCQVKQFTHLSHFHFHRSVMSSVLLSVSTIVSVPVFLLSVLILVSIIPPSTSATASTVWPWSIFIFFLLPVSGTWSISSTISWSASTSRSPLSTKKCYTGIWNKLRQCTVRKCKKNTQ